MRKKNTMLLTSVIALALCMQTANAGWFDDLSNAAKSLLSDDSNSATSSPDYATIVSALKQALEIGTRRAVSEVSKTNGFLDNANIRIPLPPQVAQAGKLMRQFGMSELADQFEASMNHAAEKAAPQATDIIINAVKNMTISDAKQILHGNDDAATQYFKHNTSDQLTKLFRPIISQSLNEVGSTKYYNQLSEQLAAVPIVGQQLNVNLPDYVTQQALNGLFVMLAAEEKQIREDPAAQTTALLKQVFGNN